MEEDEQDPAAGMVEELRASMRAIVREYVGDGHPAVGEEIQIEEIRHYTSFGHRCYVVDYPEHVYFYPEELEPLPPAGTVDWSELELA